MSTIYLIPAPLFENEIHSISQEVKSQAVALKFYFSENIRTTRRVLKLYDKDVDIDAIAFEEMNHRSPLNTTQFLNWIKEGYDIGIMSEAGMPGIADPGSVLVNLAHKAGARIVPLTGPSSIVLSLIASGMNGQNFEFNGYLPVDQTLRNKKIKELETRAAQNITQIFIETPYRNNNLFEYLIKSLHPNLSLCIAANISSSEEIIKSQSIQDWRKSKSIPDLHKQPCVFLIGKAAT